MGIKAITIDLYGTLVKDNNVLMRDICMRINASSRVFESTPAKVGQAWLNLSKDFTKIYYGEKFSNQADLEKAILQKVLDTYRSRLDPLPILKEIKAASLHPRLYDDSLVFLNKLPLQCVILCNGDRQLLERAIEYCNLDIPLICSEDAKAYKPNTRIFEYALDMLSLHPVQVLHVGDSINHDIIPAKETGMKAVLINRHAHNTPEDLVCDLTCSTLLTLRSIIR